MALSPEEIKNRYPIPAYNYRVTILWGNTPSKDTVTLISCAEISGLNMELETVTYRHGFSFLTGYHIIPSITKEVRLSIRKGVTKDGRYLSDWMNISYPFVAPAPLSLARKRDLLIDLCDEEGLPVVRWTVLKAMPVKLEAPSFKSDASEVSFEQLDLIAHELKVEYDL